MLHYDSYIRKRNGYTQRRSEAEHRLYWSTYQKMAEQAPVPRKKSQVWMGVRWLPGALRRWWHAHLQTGMQAGGEGTQQPPFISAKGKV